MEIFTRIAELIGNRKCNITINVMSIGKEELTVSLAYRDSDCKDGAADLIVPFSTVGKPADLDAEFVSKIGALKASVDAQDAMKAYMESIEAAKKASKKETDAKAAAIKAAAKSATKAAAAKPAAPTKDADESEVEDENEATETAPAENTALKKAVEKATKLQDEKKYPQAIKAYEAALALAAEDDEAARDIINDNIAVCKEEIEKAEIEKIDIQAEWKKAKTFKQLGDYTSVLAIIEKCYPKANDGQKKFFDDEKVKINQLLSQESIFGSAS